MTALDIDIHSVDDARHYREQLAAMTPEDDRALASWRTCERCVLMIVAAVAFLAYHMISVNLEILKLPRLDVPAVAAGHPNVQRPSSGAS